MQLTQLSRLSQLSRGPAGVDGDYVRVPVVLTDSEGAVFTDADGTVLTHGTRRVRLIEESEE